MTKATTGAAILFMLTSLILAYFAGSPKTRSVVDDVSSPAPVEKKEPVKTNAAEPVKKVDFPVKMEDNTKTESAVEAKTDADATTATETKAADVATDIKEKVENTASESATTANAKIDDVVNTAGDVADSVQEKLNATLPTENELNTAKDSAMETATEKSEAVDISKEE